jgi:ribosome biogenesis GTPase A
MAKARRILKEDLKLVDLVIEVLDARIPLSSRNPDLDSLLQNKMRIVALNKEDLANREITEKWISYFNNHYPAVRLNSLTGEGTGLLLSIINETADQINRKVRKKGRANRDIRIMILGIPNVGKSALINNLAGLAITRTGNRPGVTRGRQWINVGTNIQLLDTPGILWPKFEDEDVGYKLALTGAVKDTLFDEELAAYKLIEYLLEIDRKVFEEYYGVELDFQQPYDILEIIGKKTGCLMSGGKIDRARASKMLINDFRKGKLGSISLEKPVEGEEG